MIEAEDFLMQWEAIMNFDKEARNWDTQRRRTRAETLAQVVRENWGETPQKALDFGCGTGLLTFELYPCAGEIAGFDPSREMGDAFRAKIAETGAQNVRFLTADEMAAEQYDAIFSSMVFHHIRDVDAALVRIKALLNPNGRFVWLDLDEDDGTFHQNEPDFDGHNGFSRSYVRTALAAAGFTNITVEDAYAGGRTMNGVDMNYTVFVAVAR